MEINQAIYAYHNDNRYCDIFAEDGLLGKRAHISSVIQITNVILNFSCPPDINKELLTLCAEHHDDGRVNQFKLLGKFWDSEVTHNVLGLDRFDSYLQHLPEVTIDTSISIFRDCILYHGRPALLASKESIPYVEIITAADDFENATSAISYLLKEVETDAKGYKHNDPTADQTDCSYFVIDHFARGEKFDKSVHCKTYADYILFAATLATNYINRFGKVAKAIMLQPGHGYPSILEGYRDIFNKTLQPEAAEKAYKVLSDMLEQT